MRSLKDLRWSLWQTQASRRTGTGLAQSPALIVPPLLALTQPSGHRAPMLGPRLLPDLSGSPGPGPAVSGNS